jgi:hypothetical protein
MNDYQRKVYSYSASVFYRNSGGEDVQEKFPVVAPDRAAASDLAFAYVLQVLKLGEFEIRIVGA